MAWHNGGDWAGLPDSDLGIIYSELCIAINERNYAVYRSDVQFVTPAGLRTDPTPQDFNGMTIDGTVTKNLIDQIRNATEAFAGGIKAGRVNDWLSPGLKYSFTTAASIYDLYVDFDLDILSQTSAGAPWLTMNRAQNFEHLTQIREVLDVCKTVFWWPFAHAVAPVRRYSSHSIVPTAQDHWNQILEQYEWGRINFPPINPDGVTSINTPHTVNLTGLNNVFQNPNWSPSSFRLISPAREELGTAIGKPNRGGTVVETQMGWWISGTGGYSILEHPQPVTSGLISVPPLVASNVGRTETELLGAVFPTVINTDVRENIFSLRAIPGPMPYTEVPVLGPVGGTIIAGLIFDGAVNFLEGVTRYDITVDDNYQKAGGFILDYTGDLTYG